MEGNEAAASENVEGAQKNMGWDTDNVRLGIFLVLFAIWAPMQFVPLVGHRFCQGKEALFIFSFPLILLALFLSKRRTPQTLFRLTAWAMLFAGFILANYISDGKLHLPSSEYQLAVLAGSFYFVKPRALWDHGKNLALPVAAYAFFWASFRWMDTVLFCAGLAYGVVYAVLKRNEGLLRPALLIFVASISIASWSGAECMVSGRSAYCSMAKSDLANLAIAEEAYFSQYATYTDRIQNLKGFRSYKNVTINIRHADRSSFTAMAVHPLCDGNKDHYADYFYWDSSNGGMQLF